VVVEAGRVTVERVVAGLVDCDGVEVVDGVGLVGRETALPRAATTLDRKPVLE
jgi:hypothetical protein